MIKSNITPSSVSIKGMLKLSYNKQFLFTL